VTMLDDDFQAIEAALDTAEPGPARRLAFGALKRLRMVHESDQKCVKAALDALDRIAASCFRRC
jgi:hypothetical protein